MPLITKEIHGFSGYYISTSGQVYSDRGRYPGRFKKLRQKIKKDKGYRSVCLYDSAGQSFYRLVHKLVLEAFVGPCPDGMQTRHMDGDPANNRLSNLRWGTKLENEQDRKDHGKVPRGEDNPSAKLTEEQARWVKKSRTSVQQAATACSVSVDTVRAIRNGRLWAWMT